MLKIIKLSESACFLTGSKEDVVEVKFDDKSFSGAISWGALIDILKRKATETPTDANKAKHKAEQTSPTVTASAAKPLER